LVVQNLNDIWAKKAFANPLSLKIEMSFDVNFIVRYLIGRERPKQARPIKTGATVCRVSFSPCEAPTWFVG